MDYEVFYQALQALEKSIKETMQRQQTAFKSFSKNAEKGDIKNLTKDLGAMDALLSDHQKFISGMKQLAEGFDAREYFESGDFARQLLSCCESQSVDVNGDYPVYEMFPYKVKIDAENQELNVNGKKNQCVRPQYFVADIKKNQEKLMKASFNAESFLSELAAAYDTLSAIKRKEDKKPKRDYDLMLKDLYRVLVPMQRFRKDYDAQSFAFDLARLYVSDVEFTKDGRQYQFGSGRGQSQAIRMLDKNGNEVFLVTITFFSKETEIK